MDKAIFLPSDDERARAAAWSSRRRLLTAVVAAPWLVRAGRAASLPREGAYPSRAIRIVVPNAVGGTSDLLARLVGARLAEEIRAERERWLAVARALAPPR